MDKKDDWNFELSKYIKQGEPKKVEKTAINRNRARRRIYEAIRLNFDKIPKGMDYVFVVFSKDIKKMKFSEIEKLIGELVEESKVCYNRQR